MLKMTGYDVLFNAVGNMYWVLALVCICLALWKGRTGPRKAIYALLVLALFIAPLAPDIYRTIECRSKLAKAQSLFEERCKTAGEKIYRTVDNVEGVLLMKVRPKPKEGDGSDPLYPSAALYKEEGEDGYIASFLRYERVDVGSSVRTMQLSDRPTSLPGYGFAEAIDPKDGKRYRYTPVYGPTKIAPAEYMPMPALSKSITEGVPPRYAVTYEDVVDPADRKHWVAGTTLKVVDTQTNEVLAEQTRYLFDTGLGNTAEGRNPWGWASSYVPGCSRDRRFYHDTRFFVDRILKPTSRE